MDTWHNDTFGSPQTGFEPVSPTGPTPVGGLGTNHGASSRLSPCAPLGALSRCLRARGGGLEPPITGPEPAVLPITPPPNERSLNLADRLRDPWATGPHNRGAECVQALVPDDPSQGNPQGLLGEIRDGRPPCDGGIRRRHRPGLQPDVGGNGEAPVLMKPVGDDQDTVESPLRRAQRRRRSDSPMSRRLRPRRWHPPAPREPPARPPTPVPRCTGHRLPCTR